MVANFTDMARNIVGSISRNNTVAAALLGVVCGVVFWVGMLLCQAAGFSALNLPLLLGEAFTGTATAGSYIVGLLIHLAVSAIAGVIYEQMMRYSGQAGWRVGALIALVHWGVFGLLVGTLSEGSTGLAAPGFYGVGYGATGFLEILGLTLLFGAVLGDLLERGVRQARFRAFPAEVSVADSPLANALGQGDIRFDDYKNRHAS